MAQKKLLLLFGLLLSLSSCIEYMHSKIEINPSETNTWQDISKPEIVVNNDSSELSSRVVFASGQQLRSQTADDFRELANISPIRLNGEVLSATAVQAYGDYAVITYHNHNTNRGGGIDLVNISDIRKPVLVSSLIYGNRDINHVVIEKNDLKNAKFYMLADDSKKGSAYVVEGSIQNGRFDGNNFRELQLIGSSSNNAQIYGNYLLAGTTGVGGGSGAFQTIHLSNGTISYSSNVDRGKHIDIEGNKIVTLHLTHAGEAVLSCYENSIDFSSPTATLGLGKISSILGKNVLRVKNNMAYAALSDGGWVVVNLGTMKVVHRESGLIGLANGLDVSADYIFVSHGASGILIYDKHTFTPLRSFYSNGSANYPSVNENQTLLLAANGIGGTKIISLIPYEVIYAYQVSWNNNGINSFTAEGVQLKQNKNYVAPENFNAKVAQAPGSGDETAIFTISEITITENGQYVKKYDLKVALYQNNAWKGYRVFTTVVNQGGSDPNQQLILERIF